MAENSTSEMLSRIRSALQSTAESSNADSEFAYNDFDGNFDQTISSNPEVDNVMRAQSRFASNAYSPSFENPTSDFTNQQPTSQQPSWDENFDAPLSFESSPQLSDESESFDFSANFEDDAQPEYDAPRDSTPSSERASVMSNLSSHIASEALQNPYFVDALYQHFCNTLLTDETTLAQLLGRLQDIHSENEELSAAA